MENINLYRERLPSAISDRTSRINFHWRLFPMLMWIFRFMCKLMEFISTILPLLLGVLRLYLIFALNFSHLRWFHAVVGACEWQPIPCGCPEISRRQNALRQSGTELAGGLWSATSPSRTFYSIYVFAKRETSFYDGKPLIVVCYRATPSATTGLLVFRKGQT